jgi:flagellar hook capping protein FlgD
MMGNSSSMFFRNRTIPSGAGPASMIAPFWDYIKWGDIFGYYDTDNHRFIIQWDDWQNAYNPYQHETFEVILYDPQFYETPTSDGPIMFQYQEINNIDQDNNYATIGLEDHTQTNGLLLSYANLYPETMHEIEDEVAILFTTGEGLNTGSGETDLPEVGISLLQNYPNPFNPETLISFKLSPDNDLSEANLDIFNLKGQKIRSLACNNIPVDGHYKVTWSGTDNYDQPVPSGIYFYKLTAGSFQQTRKMVLMK